MVSSAINSIMMLLYTACYDRAKTCVIARVIASVGDACYNMLT